MNEEAKAIALETENLVSIVWDKLIAWMTGLVEMLPNILVAIVVVVTAAVVARVLSRVLGRAAQTTSNNAQVVALLVVLTRLAVLGGGVFVALGILQLEKTVTSLLAGIGVIGLALGFAFQDIAANFMSGVIMAIREPFQLSDLVETHGIEGFVERVTLRATVLRTFSGQLVMIPNKDVLQNPITNFTQSGKRRVEIPVGVSYDDDLTLARDTALAAVAQLECRDASQQPEAVYEAFGASSIDLSVRFWIDFGDGRASYLEARSRGIMAIKSAFDDAEISIPFPIRTLDFGDAEAAANLLRNGAAAAAPGNSEADESPRAQA